MNLTSISDWSAEPDPVRIRSSSFNKQKEQAKVHHTKIESFDAPVNTQRQRPGFYFKAFIVGAIPGSLLGGIVLAAVLTFWTAPVKESSTTQFTTGVNNNATSTVTNGTVLSTTTTAAAVTTTVTATVTVTGTNITSSLTTTASSTSVSTTASGPLCGINMLWNATGVTVAGVTGVNGSGLNQLNTPLGIYVYLNNSSLYIADSGNQRIIKWVSGASNGILVAGVTGSSSSAANGLSKPSGIYVDSMQNMYVADTGNSRIQFFPNGSTTATTASSGWTGAPVDIPGCVYVMNQNIYVCDNGKNWIARNGSKVAGVGSAPAGEIQHSYGLVADENGTMYIANMDHNIILRWPASTASSGTGTVVAGSSAGTAGSSNTMLHTPTAVVRDSQGNLYVVDQANHRVQLFCQYPVANTSGITIGGTGTAGSTATTLSSPTGIALDSQLNVYVSDTGNARVQMFQRIA